MSETLYQMEGSEKHCILGEGGMKSGLRWGINRLRRRQSKRSNRGRCSVDSARVLVGDLEVFLRDLQNLGENQFLNDTAIDFYIQHLQNSSFFDETRKTQFLIFNSFFYKKLLSLFGSSKSDDIDEKTIKNLSRWCKGANIFDKSYVCIPIHDRLHWSLAIICSPKSAFSLQENPNSLPESFIVHLDSLSTGGHSSQKIFRVLRGYLVAEWRLQNGSQSILMFPESNKRFSTFLPGRRVQVPRQDNEFDCGCFLLYYLKMFSELAPEFLTLKDINEKAIFGKDWFPADKPALLRVEIRTLMEEKMKGVALNDTADLGNEEDSDTELLREIPAAFPGSHGLPFTPPSSGKEYLVGGGSLNAAKDMARCSQSSRILGTPDVKLAESNSESQATQKDFCCSSSRRPLESTTSPNNTFDSQSADRGDLCRIRSVCDTNDGHPERLDETFSDAKGFEYDAGYLRSSVCAIESWKGSAEGGNEDGERLWWEEANITLGYSTFMEGSLFNGDFHVDSDSEFAEISSHGHDIDRERSDVAANHVDRSPKLQDASAVALNFNGSGNEMSFEGNGESHGNQSSSSKSLVSSHFHTKQTNDQAVPWRAGCVPSLPAMRASSEAGVAALTSFVRKQRVLDSMAPGESSERRSSRLRMKKRMGFGFLRARQDEPLRKVRKGHVIRKPAPVSVSENQPGSHGMPPPKKAKRGRPPRNPAKIEPEQLHFKTPALRKHAGSPTVRSPEDSVGRTNSRFPPCETTENDLNAESWNAPAIPAPSLKVAQLSEETPTIIPGGAVPAQNVQSDLSSPVVVNESAREEANALIRQILPDFLISAETTLNRETRGRKPRVSEPLPETLLLQALERAIEPESERLVDSGGVPVEAGKEQQELQSRDDPWSLSSPDSARTRGIGAWNGYSTALKSKHRSRESHGSEEDGPDSKTCRFLEGHGGRVPKREAGVHAEPEFGVAFAAMALQQSREEPEKQEIRGVVMEVDPVLLDRIVSMASRDMVGINAESSRNKSAKGSPDVAGEVLTSSGDQFPPVSVPDCPQDSVKEELEGESAEVFQRAAIIKTYHRRPADGVRSCQLAEEGEAAG